MLKQLSIFSQKENFIPHIFKTKANAERLNKIYKHPFNQQLFNGTLSEFNFGNYLHADYIYLHNYARVLNQLSSQIAHSNPKLTNQLDKLSQDIISGELEMQKNYARYFTITPTFKPVAVIEEYIEFIEKNALHAELPVALCSILPCFWIYSELGSKKSETEQRVSNPYKEWIQTYSSPDFVSVTRELSKTINDLAKQAPDDVLDKMNKTLEQGIEYELKFFDSVIPVQLTPDHELPSLLYQQTDTPRLHPFHY